MLAIDEQRSVETQEDKLRSDLLDLVESQKGRRILAGTIQGVERSADNPNIAFQRCTYLGCRLSGSSSCACGGGYMKCACGNDRFFAHQVCHHDVIVDGAGEYTEDRIIYYSGKPFAPFTCTKCGAEYDELKE